MTAVGLETIVDGVVSGRTPHRIFLARAARARIDAVARMRHALSREPLQLVASFSFKTNPRSELLALARDAGFFAETISRDEVSWALGNGFVPERTIYNGPFPLSDTPGAGPLAIVFADSVEAFIRNSNRSAAAVSGIRMRPSMIASRFGIPIEDESELRAAVASGAPDRPFAVSFHARREDFKGASWRDVADDVLQRAVALELSTGRRVSAFNVGGGWTPEEFDAGFESDMRWMVGRIIESLPACTRLFFEPGQAVCTPTEALLTEVAEVRRRRGRQEIIVDIGYPDWPQMHEYAHPVFAWRNERWVPVGPGPDRFGGRTCLEYDMAEGLRFPSDIAPGDRLLIGAVGAYDHSMAFDFARGTSADGRTD
ncbi:MAG: diaminopimelate decarboxylase [Candidatus Eremiobacteraeota bacterium]|nr:diaminopimelate decarboxylase [Candidatus Eremiobacteraeota bacterium]